MAGEICIAIIPEIVKSALEAATRQTYYSFCFNRYVDDLQRKKRELTIRKESVQNRLEKAKQATKNVDILVINWLEEVKSLIEEVQKLEEKVNSNKSYCFGHFPNWIWRYHVAKLAEEKTKEVIELNQKSNNFLEFSRPSTPPGMKYFSSEGFFYFENTRTAYDEILQALKDDEVFMIGLYGMGGCGKTTLAKQVGLAAEKTFGKVAFAVVSNNVDVQKIQGEIASYLNLNLQKEETMLKRARRLWERLTSGEKILIILDDVWGKLDFEAIGIPLDKSHKGCKVLLTTRRLQVCTLMGCQRSILLLLLNEEEAWVLFQKHSGMGDETSSPLKSLARDIAKECKGLPVAIAAVASTLKGKSLSEWQEALERLKEATPIDVEEGLRDPYKCLQLSYDNLKNEETKSLFLLCSVFPEDFEIHEEFLARYGIGLGLVGKVSSYVRARNKVSEAINKLIDSCLLLKGNEEQCVKMHDLVRDMALFIAKKDKNVIMGIESKERDSTLEDNYAAIRYLWNFKTQESDNLSYLLGCSKLEFLCVKISEDLVLEDEVFKTMKDLRVLIIQGERYSRNKNLSMAKSIQLLTNLRCLLLEGWSLGDISFIGCLKKLESLVLWSCSFKKLPNEITELSKLKLLDLWHCKIEKNPNEMIRRCSQLEELYFLDNHGSWNEDREIPVVATSTLQRYRITIGRYYLANEPENFYITRGLWLNNFDMSSNAAIKELAHRAEFLELLAIKNDCKNIIPDMVDTKGGMNQLTKLNLLYCDKIECLVEKIENVFSNLVELYIVGLNSFETWWRGPHVGKLNLFCSLKYLKLSDCPMLTSVFTCSIAQSLVVLETLKIRFCEGIKQIIRDEEKDNDEKYSTVMFPKLQMLLVGSCDKLEYLMPVSLARSFLKLARLSIGDCGNLIHVFGQSLTNHEDDNQNALQIIILPLLQELEFSYLRNIKAICPENYCPSWPSLKKLSWDTCPKLKVESVNKCIDGGSRVIMFSQEQQLGSNVMHDNQVINELSLSQMVQSIENVHISKCQKIEGIFQLSENPTSGDLQPLTSLKYLELNSLDELSYIYKGPRRILCLQNLQNLRVFSCAKLKIIFSATVFGSLSQLEELEVRNCPQLEQIIENGKTLELTNELNQHPKNNRSEKFDDTSKKPGTSKCLSLYKRLSRRPLNLHKPEIDEEDQKNQNGERVQEVQRHVSMFPRLKVLRIHDCGLLESIFPISSHICLQNLQKLCVSSCAKLKIIFSATVFESLSQLEELEVRNCPQLDQTIEDGKTLELTNELNHYPKNNRSKEFDDTSKKPGTSKCPSRRPLNLHKLKTDEEDQKNQNGERVREVQRHASMFPRLKLLYIDECGLLQSIFPISFSNLLKLETLRVDNCNIHAVFQREGFPITSEQNPLISRLNYLELENLPELRFLCKGPKKSLNFEYLSDLTVERCGNLIFIFSSSVLRSLPLLKHLTIKQCEQLQQIIEEDEKDHYSLSYHSQPVCFPSLTTIVIENCINLKYLFTVLSSHELPQLYHLNLQKCFLLETVFAHIESYTKDERATIFPGLKTLELIELPNLINIYEGFMWHSVEDRTVRDCPKLTSTVDPFKDLAQEDQNQESKEAHETPNETPSMDGALSANTANTIQLDMMDLQSQAPLTNSKEGKDTRLQTLTSQDVNMSAPLAPINQEYLTSEKGGNIKKMENNNVTEQCTTTYPESTEAHQKLVGTVLQESSLHAAPFPQIVPKEYNQNDSGIISDKASNIDKGRGDLQTQGLNTSVNHFNTEESLQKKNTILREFTGETIMESVQKGPASVKSTMETSSLEMVRKTTMTDPVSIDHQQEANKVHLGDLPTDLDVNKATDAGQKMSQVSSENKEEELVNESISMEQQKTPDEMKGDASLDLPTLELEYGTFRDFGAMKKKHVPLIEKAFANHPSLRDWHKKFRRPEMKRLGYTILGNTLEFLESTRWRDLTEEKKAEFESLVNGMEAFGFDIQWLGNTRAKIKHSKLDDGSIKQKQMLEKKVAEEQRQVEEMRVRLQKYKLELEAIEAELGNYNDFVGF